MTVMNKSSLERLCSGDKPLIRNAVDLGVQIQQNGIDITIKQIQRFVSAGVIDFDNSKRELAGLENIEPDGSMKHGVMYFLPEGSYLITFNEIVNIEMNHMARACPRSSLMRCGATMNTAVWDAGYEGQSQALLTIHNPYGLWLHKDARIAQLVVEELNSAVNEGYQGIYQKEGL